MLKCLEEEWKCWLGPPAQLLPMRFPTWSPSSVRGPSLLLGSDGADLAHERNHDDLARKSHMILGTAATCNGIATTLNLNRDLPGNCCAGRFHRLVATLLRVGEGPLRISCHTARERSSETRHPLRGIPVMKTNKERRSAHAQTMHRLREMAQHKTNRNETTKKDTGGGTNNEVRVFW